MINGGVVLKKGKILGLLALSALLLTGCVDSMPDLTAEESDIITEYAVSLILKYSPYYDYKIVSEEEVAAARALEETDVEEPAREETETEAEEDGMTGAGPAQPAESGQDEPETEVIQPADELDFAAELGIDDLILRYQSYEICDSYPKDNPGFQVNAQQGKKLLVIHFDLEGSDEEDTICDMIDHEIRLRLELNDSISVTALGTEMLPDALTAYTDVIPVGETVDVVAIAEVDEDVAQTIGTLVVRMSSAGGSCTARLE